MKQFDNPDNMKRKKNQLHYRKLLKAESWAVTSFTTVNVVGSFKKNKLRPKLYTVLNQIQGKFFPHQSVWQEKVPSLIFAYMET